MSAKPKLLDLFSCSGGASVGYSRAGFEVTGVDIKKRPRYPYKFIQANALEVFSDKAFMSQFDAYVGSPPCQSNTRAQHLRKAQGNELRVNGINLIPETREAFEFTGKPYVIENVEGADMRSDLLLCGSMFPELHVYDESGRRWLKRHRLFESNIPLAMPSACDHKNAGVRPLGIYGSMRDNIPSGGQTARNIEEARTIMGIDWMLWDDLKESIPPAYTEWIGRQLIQHV